MACLSRSEHHSGWPRLWLASHLETLRCSHVSSEGWQHCRWICVLQHLHGHLRSVTMSDHLRLRRSLL